jgi:hypothetical protein
VSSAMWPQSGHWISSDAIESSPQGCGHVGGAITLMPSADLRLSGIGVDLSGWLSIGFRRASVSANANLGMAPVPHRCNFGWQERRAKVIVILHRRQPHADMQYWPGRRMFAALDAIGWPAAVAFGMTLIPASLGVVGTVAFAFCALGGAMRFSRAVLANHRYRFTSLCVARVALALLVVGAVASVAV